jgi:F420-non-reducing hydrogenase small subunit
MTIKIATLKLCGCSGCHISLLENLGDILDLIKGDKIDLKFSQLLMDPKKLDEEVDLLFVEGCVMTDHDRASLLEFGKKAKKIISLGSCACYGGPAALGNKLPREQILGEMYSHSKSSDNLPRVGQIAWPIERYVNVDYHLPGCPPEGEFLRDFLKTIIENGRPLTYPKTVCDECSRKRNGASPEEIRRIIETGEIDPEMCLVEQGIMCMGKTTRGGCGAKCPNAGAPCIGCQGPIEFSDISPVDFHEIEYPYLRRGAS